MKLVILAGGYGTRISEETHNKPKPLIEIGKKPIIWHIMKMYSFYGVKKFIICQGYKGHMFKKKLIKDMSTEGWEVDFVNTGIKTMTGGRLKRVQKYLKNDDNFCLTYGDGLSNIDIRKLIKFHLRHKKILTITAVREASRFGILSINKKYVVDKIQEKPVDYINGGFFVVSKKIFKYLKNDQNIFEKDCLPIISKQKQLMAYIHDGFWSCMDTLRDKIKLSKLWESKRTPWKVWNE